MKLRIFLCFVLAAASLGASSIAKGEMPGTAFTYQGHLKQNGEPANGPVNLDFDLYAAETGGKVLAAGTVVPDPVDVTDGLFTVTIDFGDDAFNGQARWVEITVGGQTLIPRQKITPTPIALSLPGLWTQQNATSPNLIAGFSGNVVNDDAIGVHIGGGGSSGKVNSASGTYNTISGGEDNLAGENNVGNPDNSRYASIAGGSQNRARSWGSTVGGGFNNQALLDGDTVTGGFNNKADSGTSFVGGGNSNMASGHASVVGGGNGNQATGLESVVAGGDGNTASGFHSTIGGGSGNIASGDCSFVPGGCSNFAGGDGSFAAGTGARAEHQGAFVWGDSSTSETASTGPNQFIVRATGGIWLGSDGSPNIPEGQFLATSTGAYLGRGGVWANNCDVAMKENFAAVDAREILQRVAALPILSWNYQAESDSVRHIGPTAQDFSAAFAVGQDDTHIATLDADGVALAAIQGLYQLVQEKEREIGDLKARLTVIEGLVEQLARSDEGSTQ